MSEPPPFDAQTEALDVVRELRVDLSDANVLVTGTTSGIGEATMEAVLAAKPRTLVVLNRSTPSSDAWKRAVASSDTKVVNVPCDLERRYSVREAAAAVARLVDHLDVVVFNSGVFVSGASQSAQYRPTVDRNCAINHLGHFYLWRQLAPLTTDTRRRVRLVLVASNSHHTVSLASLSDELDPTIIPARAPRAWRFESAHFPYARSKHANVVMAARINRVEDHVDAIAVHPGTMVATNIVHNGFGTLIGSLVVAVTSRVSRSVAQAAATGVLAAVADAALVAHWNDGAAERGGVVYLDECQRTDAEPSTHSVDVQERVWRESDVCVDKM